MSLLSNEVFMEVVYLPGDDRNYVKLPLDYSKELTVHGRQHVLELLFSPDLSLSSYTNQWSDCLTDEGLVSVYVCWNGGLCTSLQSDVMEVPASLSQDILQIASSCESFATVKVLEYTPKATRIELYPQTKADWDFVSSQGQVIEELLLRQYSIVIYSDILTIRINKYSAISFIVKEVNDGNGNAYRIDNDDDIFDGNEDCARMKDKLRLLRHRHRAVMYIDVNTEVLVAPWVDKSTRQSSSEEKGEKSLSTSFEDKYHDGEDPDPDLREQEHRTICTRVYEKAIQTLEKSDGSLQCMPQCLRGQDCSFWSSNSNNGNSNNNNPDSVLQAIPVHHYSGGDQDVSPDVDSLESSLSLFMQDIQEEEEYKRYLIQEHSVHNPVSNTSRNGEKQMVKNRYSSNRSRLSKNENVTLVHPSFFYSFVKTLLDTDKKEHRYEYHHSRQALHDSVLVQLAYREGEEVYIGSVSIDSPLTTPGSVSDNYEGRERRLTTFIALNENVRPGKVSLPDGLRSALQIDDFDTVYVSLCNDVVEAKGTCGGDGEVKYALHAIERCYYDDGDDDVPLFSSKPSTRGNQASLTTLHSALLRWYDSMVSPSILIANGYILKLILVDCDTHEQHHIEYQIDLCSSGSVERGGVDRNDVSHVIISNSRDSDENDNVRIKFESFLSNCSIAGEPRVLYTRRCQQHNLSLITNRSVDIDEIDDQQQQQQIHGVDTLIKNILLNCYPRFLPQAMLDYLRYIHQSNNLAAVSPSIGCLVTGISGSGRTRVMKEVQKYLQKTRNLVVATHYLNCSEFVSKHAASSMATLFTELDLLFKEFRKKSPSVLILDNLDVLTKSTATQASGDGQGGVYDEKAAFISMHLERHLQCIYDDSINAIHRSIMDLCEYSGANNDDNDNDGGGDGDRQYKLMLILQKCLSCSNYIIATVDDVQNISRRLTEAPFFTDIYSMPSLTRSARISLFHQSLHRYGISCVGDASKNNSNNDNNEAEMSMVAQDHLLTLTEGYVARDFDRLAMRILNTKSQDVLYIGKNGVEGGKSSHGTLWCSIEEIMNEIYSYNMIHRGSTTSSKNMDQGGDSAGSGDSWSDIGGFEDLKKDLLQLYRAPTLYRSMYRQLPIKMPRASLFYGPPGCGKTFIAARVAQKCGLQYKYIAGPQLLGKYIGSSEKAVRTLFQQAKDSGKSTLIFFDEFESLAAKRGKDNTGVTDRVVNQFLTFLDGVESTMGSVKGSDDDQDDGGQIYIIAATCRPDLIDAALLRPGRIEKHFYIGLPSAPDMYEVLCSHLRTFECDEDVKSYLDDVVRQDKIRNFTAADCKAVIGTAFLNATKRVMDSSLDPGAPLNSNNQKIVIKTSDVHSAFLSTRPFLSQKDQLFYQHIHNKFRTKGSSNSSRNDEKRSPFKTPPSNRSGNRVGKGEMSTASRLESKIQTLVDIFEPTKSSGHLNGPQDNGTISESNSSKMKIVPARRRSVLPSPGRSLANTPGSNTTNVGGNVFAFSPSASTAMQSFPYTMFKSPSVSSLSGSATGIHGRIDDDNDLQQSPKMENELDEIITNDGEGGEGNNNDYDGIGESLFAAYTAFDDDINNQKQALM